MAGVVMPPSPYFSGKKVEKDARARERACGMPARRAE
jgi:hypothetical protein